MRALRLLGTSVVVFLAWAAAAAAEPRDLVVIPQSAQDVLIERGIPTTLKGSFFLAEWSLSQQEAMRNAKIPFEVIFRDVTPETVLYLFELHDGEEPPLSWRPLFRQGRSVILHVNDAEAEKLSLEGHHPVRLWHFEHGWEKSKALLVPYDCSPKPLITEILGKTTQTKWTDWIEKLSGEESVQIDGTTYTIATRFTSTMFSGAANAKGFDFVRQQAQAWKFTGATLEEDPFNNPANSKNLVLTIPGQTTPGSQVLLTAHLDSIWQGGSSSTSAPGANDNGTGSATLLEAARILRQYRFDRTIKIIFWTGEEQGLFGSAAYTQDHSMAPILGVLNLDMFGYDANNDRCFEIHVGSLPASNDIGTCFNSSILSYALGLSRDYLTGTAATDRSDHASFWNVGVGAIEIAENFFNNNQPGGCVGAEANPNYHTNNDRVATNMHPSYGISIAKAALATISAMAVPLNACFSATPAISATPGSNQVELSWPAVPGASSYRVYRAGNGCGGNFVSLGETSATTYMDSIAVPTTYAYKIEAVTADGVCFSEESNCVLAAPIFHHASASGATYTDVCLSGGPGDGDGVVDPGEIVTMPVTLLNDGNMPLTSITGTLSSPSAGVTVVDPSADWPNLAAAASSPTNPDHFTFQVDSGVACGTDLSLNVQAVATEGSWNGAFVRTVGTVLPGNATVLNENFSAGIPATWTIVNGGTGGGAAATWTTANPGARTFLSPLVAPVAIVDSDNATSAATQDEELLTPVLNLSTALTATLQFDHYFRWYNLGLNEIADVDVRSSLTGGNWVNVSRNQGASSPNPEHKSINITAQAAGASDVQIRFHYYQGQFEWWWMVDNVRVDITAPAGCNSNPCAAPAGAKPVNQMNASRIDDTTLHVDWDVASCISTDYEILYGELSSLPSYTLLGSVCGIGALGTTTWSAVPASDLWFLVTGTDGAGTEASWGDATGGPRLGATPSGQCGSAARNNAASCP